MPTQTERPANFFSQRNHRKEKHDKYDREPHYQKRLPGKNSSVHSAPVPTDRTGSAAPILLSVVPEPGHHRTQVRTPGLCLPALSARLPGKSTGVSPEQNPVQPDIPRHAHGAERKNTGKIQPPGYRCPTKIHIRRTKGTPPQGYGKRGIISGETAPTRNLHCQNPNHHRHPALPELDPRPGQLPSAAPVLLHHTLHPGKEQRGIRAKAPAPRALQRLHDPQYALLAGSENKLPGNPAATAVR